MESSDDRSDAAHINQADDPMHAQTHPPDQCYPICLRDFQLYGWMPDSSLTVDENYLDLTMIITRSSPVKMGHCACVLTDSRYSGGALQDITCGIDEEAEEHTRVQADDSIASNLRTQTHPSNREFNGATLTNKVGLQKSSTGTSLNSTYARSIFDGILGASVNKPLFDERDSDIHAEIACLGQACRNGQSAIGSTAYITLPPCKRCFAALIEFGVRRVVSRRSPADGTSMMDIAQKHGMEMISFSREENRRQMQRINGRLHSSTEMVNSVDDDARMALADERKQRRKAVREAKRQTKSEQ